tara:strand:+ start:303 stop:749 length:447 start_codon:yes stop_codon:yes gene_type:complete
MSLLTLKALGGLLLSAFVLFALFTVWQSVFGLLPDAIASDTQSLKTFDRLIEDVNKLGKQDQTQIVLDEDYSLILTNTKGFNLKEERFPFCKLNSCICLCQDEDCKRVSCKEVKNNKKFKENYQKILGNTKFLYLTNTKEGILIEPKS